MFIIEFLKVQLKNQICTCEEDTTEKSLALSGQTTTNRCKHIIRDFTKRLKIEEIGRIVGSLK